MGDRISIQFKTGQDISVAFFSHWDGLSLLTAVKEYFKEFKREIMVDNLDNDLNIHSNRWDPLSRLEPDTLMVDFIRWFCNKDDGRVWSNYYLGKDANDGDNSDNGNYIIDTKEALQNA